MVGSNAHHRSKVWGTALHILKQPSLRFSLTGGSQDTLWANRKSWACNDPLSVFCANSSSNLLVF